MSGVNKHIIVGRLGKDPELRILESGNKVVTFSVATSESYKDKTSGEKKEITDWHNVVAWNAKAEALAKYVKKGDMIFLEGKSRTRSWEKDGITRYTTELVVDEFCCLQSKSSDRAPTPDQEYKTADQQEQGTSKDDLPF